MTKRDPEIKDTIQAWDEYQTYCINHLNYIKGEFDKNKPLVKFEEVHKEKQYKFKFDEQKVAEIIKHWMRNSLKFSMYTILEKNNSVNLNREIFLREFRYFYHYEENKTKAILNKFSIWIDDINISHIIREKHLLFYGKWHKPDGCV